MLARGDVAGGVGFGAVRGGVAAYLGDWHGCVGIEDDEGSADRGQKGC